MAVCETCGNDCNMAFEITSGRARRTPSTASRCAMHKMTARRCEHCCSVQSFVVDIGHQVEGRFFCCAHCASAAVGVMRRSTTPDQRSTRSPAPGTRSRIAATIRAAWTKPTVGGAGR